MRKARAFLVITALVACSVTVPARAEDAPDPTAVARKEYGAGKEAYAAKRFAEAALHFEAAAAIKPHAVTLYTAALAWESAGKPERAADDFSRSLDVPGLDPKQADNAKARLASLEAALGTITVKGPEGAHVQLEGLSETTVPARLHAPPGGHVLIARFAGDKPSVRKDVVLEANQVGSLEVKEEAVAATTPEPPKDEPAPHPDPPPPVKAAPAKFPLMRAAGVGAAGLGVGMLIGGTVLGLSALGAKDAYNAGPTQSSYDHANSLATWTTVAFIAGSVFTAGGVALLLIPEKESKDAGASGVTLRLTATLGGGSLSGAF